MCSRTAVRRHREGPDLVNPPPGPDWLYKREGGQLLLLRIPGA
jgi:hypothetical protein